jgi:hypothetical protein
MSKSKKKQPTEKQLIAAIDRYKQWLYDNPKVSVTKFHHYQEALYGVKCLIWDAFGSPRKSEIGATK